MRSRIWPDSILLILGAITLAAWSVIALQSQAITMTTVVNGHVGGGMAMHHTGHHLSGASPSLWVTGSSWLVMIAAMMSLLLLEPLRNVRSRSFSSRRRRSMLWFTTGYILVWIAGCLFLHFLASVLQQALGHPWALWIVGTITLVWQMSPAKQSSLNLCHRQPTLAAFGWQADLGALRYGTVSGVTCFGSCGWLMLLTFMVDSGHAMTMLAVTLFIIAERFEQVRTPAWQWRFPCRFLAIILAQIRFRALPAISRN